MLQGKIFFTNYIAKNKLQKIRPMLWFQFKSLTWHFLANQKFFIQKFLLENNFFDLIRPDRHSKNLVDSYVLSCQADHYEIPRILIQK